MTMEEIKEYFDAQGKDCNKILYIEYSQYKPYTPYKVLLCTGKEKDISSVLSLK